MTELVYGTTRMRRACDWLVDRFLLSDLDPTARAVPAPRCLPARVPRHARPRRGERHRRGRAPQDQRAWSTPCCARWPGADNTWPDDATRLSYPDWIIDRLTADLGADDAARARSRR